MKSKIPLQLSYDNWKAFKLLIQQGIIYIDEDLEEDRKNLPLKTIACLLAELVIRIDVRTAHPCGKFTLSITAAQALALHQAYTLMYIQAHEPLTQALLQVTIITKIDKAIA